jgi:hypothetical protein
MGCRIAPARPPSDRPRRTTPRRRTAGPTEKSPYRRAAGEVAAPQGRRRVAALQAAPRSSPHRTAGEVGALQAANRIWEHHRRAVLPYQTRFGLPTCRRSYSRGFGLPHAVASICKQLLQGLTPTSGDCWNLIDIRIVVISRILPPATMLLVKITVLLYTSLVSYEVSADILRHFIRSFIDSLLLA